MDFEGIKADVLSRSSRYSHNEKQEIIQGMQFGGEKLN
jgi:hypothetical protein